jgi:ABC-2 type transport system ATP-binding protein
MLAGLIRPTSGQILFDGEDIFNDIDSYKRRLGYIPEEAHVYTYLSGLEYLQLVGRLHGLSEAVIERKSNDLLELLALRPHRYSRIATYSKGMKQRVLVAAALLHDPELLIFDEPQSGLDVTSAVLFRYLLEELARAGKTVLFISHVFEVVEQTCQHVIVIHKSSIVADESPGTLIARLGVSSLERAFGVLVQQGDLPARARHMLSVMQSA